MPKITGESPVPVAAQIQTGIFRRLDGAERFRCYAEPFGVNLSRRPKWTQPSLEPSAILIGRDLPHLGGLLFM